MKKLTPSQRLHKRSRLIPQASKETQEIYDKFLKRLAMIYIDPLQTGGDSINPNITYGELDKNNIHSAIMEVMGSRYREILTCYAVLPFIMPGLIWIDESVSSKRKPSLEEATIKKGTAMLVRIDERTPDIVDIEVIRDRDNSTMFTLNNEEYTSIYKKLKGRTTECTNSLVPPQGYLR